jgi:hypothetical protein
MGDTMKKSELYIQKLESQFRCLSPANIKIFYEEINKLDWAVFRSYMADQDKPQERVEAEEKFTKFKNLYSPIVQKIIDKIREYMKKDEDYNIHKMDEDV